MTAPSSWVKGRLYLATSNTSEASPLAKAVDYNYDHGVNNEDVAYAGAGITTKLMLLSSPSIAINYIRDRGENLVVAATRYWKANGLGVKWYLYINLTDEATVYAYGYAAFEGVSLAGGATSGNKGAFTLVPGPEEVWDDHLLT